MIQLDGRTVTVTRLDADHVSIGIDTTAFDPWVVPQPDGQAARLFSLPTPYAADDLALLKYVQSADTMTLTHPTYSARKLTRSGHAAWTLTPITFAPSTLPPTGCATSGRSAAFVVVTAINDATGEESLPCSEAGSSNGSGGTWNWKAVPAARTTTSTKRRARSTASLPRCRPTAGPTATSTPTSRTRRPAAARRSAPTS